MRVYPTMYGHHAAAMQPFDSHRAAVKAKLLVGKYPLQSETIVSRFSQRDDTSLLCDLEAETRAHFLLHCNKLQAARQPWVEKILLHHNIDQIPRREEDVEKLVSYILDPSSGPDWPHAVDELMYLENTSRRLCVMHYIYMRNARTFWTPELIPHMKTPLPLTVSPAKSPAQECLMILYFYDFNKQHT